MYGLMWNRNEIFQDLRVKMCSMKVAFNLRCFCLLISVPKLCCSVKSTQNNCCSSNYAICTMVFKCSELWSIGGIVSLRWVAKWIQRFELRTVLQLFFKLLVRPVLSTFDYSENEQSPMNLNIMSIVCKLKRLLLVSFIKMGS